ncbi:hypothetical protein B0H15DRAFT_956677 [Mycena belliarum]|uniref:Uncharacterized protein n=1 Tax=Mycena belliarum TaxID=1033014 RepID=A0AAD6XF03_9AGAR|nr:hypothetical protein B0H15DRAFT_956677 [Mycena belliae]
MVEIILPPRPTASPPQDHAAGVATSVRLPRLKTGSPPMCMHRRVCRPAAFHLTVSARPRRCTLIYFRGTETRVRVRVRMRTPARRALQSSVPSSTRATMRALPLPTSGSRGWRALRRTGSRKKICAPVPPRPTLFI